MREERNQRQRPSLHPWRLACTKSARSVHRGGTHQRMQARSAHAGSVSASWQRASTHAGRLVGCMHSRLLSWRRAQAFNARDGPTKPRRNGRTTTPPTRPHSSDLTVKALTQRRRPLWPLLRVSGKGVGKTEQKLRAWG